MNHFSSNRTLYRVTIGICLCLLMAGCAMRGPYTTSRDKTAKGAGIGAAVGALASILDGKKEADEILARAAIGAVVGGSIGAYMDAQEEKIARIPGTRVERIDRNTLLVKFDSDVLFEVNSSALNSRSRGTLDKMTTVLTDFPKTAVVVQGHTDSSGGEAHNQALSERRAGSVRNFFVNQGIAPTRLVAMGYGETMPIADNTTQHGRALNRRVDVLLRARAR
ncbi:OmpA family protein [Sulfidibacter corallicola]|uniref:OmpA family protein n=1 Tax=Sulfidibacter corallicola TaxID=2818388 RepID=A0A8A4TNG7_SULCO|nr:OmpA family protein [Sulfidibacter corallicola]QTD51103.1 OmpA family protein [Sulfidibacter corallicola]